MGESEDQITKIRQNLVLFSALDADDWKGLRRAPNFIQLAQIAKGVLDKPAGSYAILSQLEQSSLLSKTNQLAEFLKSNQHLPQRIPEILSDSTIRGRIHDQVAQIISYLLKLSDVTYVSSRLSKNEPQKALDPLEDEEGASDLPYPYETFGFSELSKRVLWTAREECKRWNHSYLGAEHITLAVLKIAASPAAKIIAKMGCDSKFICSQLEMQMQKGDGGLNPRAFPFTERAKKILTLARDEAKDLNWPSVEPEHLLLGLLREESSVAAELFKRLGIDFETTKGAIKYFTSIGSKNKESTIRGGKNQLLLGDKTLDDLFGQTELGKCMDEADEAAFRLGAALSQVENESEMQSWHLLAGYLLTAEPGRGKSERALVALAWENFSKTQSSVIKQVGPSQIWRSIFPKSEETFKKASEMIQLVGPTKLSLGLRKMLLRSVDVAMEAKRPQPFSTRHLLACLLGPREWGVDSPGTAKISQFAFDLSEIRRGFRDWISEWRSKDAPEVIDDLLGFTGSSRSSRNLPDDDNIGYRETYSSFAPDRSPYRRTVNATLDDALGMTEHACHLAQLIAAKDTSMPLSIGLFGSWGAGKSHFIDLLDENLVELSQLSGKAFHKHIVQIRFNAWHYLDTNLWANLVCEIFDQLFAKLGTDTRTGQIENLKKKLTDQSALAAEAKAALEIARNARKEAEEKLLDATKARVKEEENVDALLDDLSKLVTPELTRQLSTVADGLGFPKLKESFAELETRARDVGDLGGRVQVLILAIFTGSHWWIRASLLGVVLTLPLGISWLSLHGHNAIQDLLSGAGKTIAQIIATIGGFSVWISSQIKGGNSLIEKLEDAYGKVKEVRAKRELKDDATLALKELAAKRQVEDEARCTLQQAEEKMRVLRAELAELAPGRQLLRFLKNRTSAEDYRRHLGLVSLVRRDFEQLSQLLTQAGTENDTSLPRIDRIVIYIDDLDRCRSERVIEVLEAVHLLLAFPLFAVVVAVDPRWVRQSLLEQYPRLLGTNDEPKQRLRRPATPQDYLEKIFQVPFNLQAMNEDGFKMLVNQLFPISENEKNLSTISSTSISPAPLETFTLDSTRSGFESQSSKPALAVKVEPVNFTNETASREEPLDPQRLTLTRKELNDFHCFQPLFQTPRSVKRFANTYCLIRVGVKQNDWNDYLGFNETSGLYRIPMFLLAVSSAFPTLARPWLGWLMSTQPKQWQLSEENIKHLVSESMDTSDADWSQLAHALEEMDLVRWPTPSPSVLREWVPRVIRYSF